MTGKYFLPSIHERKKEKPWNIKGIYKGLSVYLPKIVLLLATSHMEIGIVSRNERSV